MEKIKDFLFSIGLGKNEVEVYSTLLVLGTASVLEISKRTMIHRSNIYDALRSLVHRGLVYEINLPSKLFSARPIESLVQYLKQKETELNEIIKDFQGRRVSKQPESISRISKGIFAAREAINSLLETGKPILVYGIPSHANEKLGYILKEFHKNRIKKKVPMKHIYNITAMRRAKLVGKMRYTEARILPSKYESLTSTNISGDKVILITWEEDIHVIEIIDKNIAKTYQSYFDILWSKAKKIA